MGLGGSQQTSFMSSMVAFAVRMLENRRILREPLRNRIPKSTTFVIAPTARIVRTVGNSEKSLGTHSSSLRLQTETPAQSQFTSQGREKCRSLLSRFQQDQFQFGAIDRHGKPWESGTRADVENRSLWFLH